MFRNDYVHTSSHLSPSRVVLFFILFTASFLEASQTYILSYRAQIKNAVVISESYYFSKAMKEIQAHPSRQLTIYSPDETNINTIMNTNKDKIIDFVMQQSLHTRSHERVSQFKSSSLISITIPPTYITVDFKNDYAIITRLITQ